MKQKFRNVVLRQSSLDRIEICNRIVEVFTEEELEVVETLIEKANDKE